MARRKSASSKNHSLSWYIAGLISGLALATVFILLNRSDVVKANPGAGPQISAQDSLIPADGPNGPQPKESRPRYDFFTVLPEMEVVVPDEEISAQAEAPASQISQSSVDYILQAGSFQSGSDADSLKARLALLGVVANVQQVEVNGDTWHRVRIGPLANAREADRIRRQLQDNGFDAMVLKDG